MPKVTPAHREARREQILQAGLRCVVREGFHKTTMADVIGEAGLSAGAVYGYFKSKTELIRGIADRVLGEVAHRLDDLATRDEPVAPIDCLEVMLGFADTMAAQPGGDYTRVGIQVWAEAVRDEEIHRIARDRMGKLRAGVAAALRRAQADGNLDPDSDPEQVAQLVFGVLPGYVIQRLILGDVSTDSHLAAYRGLVGEAMS